MTARPGQYWLLWQAALGSTREFSRYFLLLSGLLVTLVATLSAVYGGSSGAWFGWALCIPAGFLLFAWALALVPGALRLNSPANAQLVPGMRRRLIELALLVWLAAMGAMAAGMYVLSNAPGPWLWLAAVITLGTAAMAAGVALAWLIYPPLLAAIMANKFLPAPMLAAAQDMSMSPLGLAALPLLGVLVTLAMFPQAGRRHWRMFAHQASAGGAVGTVLDRQPGRMSWEGLLPRRAVAGRKPGALLMLALGRSLPATAANSLAAAALMIGALVYLARHGVLPLMTPYFAQLSWVTISGVLVIFVFQAGMAPAWLARTTGEQALVRLAPALPASPAAFNTLLARAQLRQSLAIWLMASGAALLLGVVSGVSGNGLWQQAGVCCMTLPALGLALRDHASSKGWPMGAMWAAAFGLSYVGPLAGVLARALFGLPFWPVALFVALTLSAVLVRYRLGLVRAAPIAFPAGRH